MNNNLSFEERMKSLLSHLSILIPNIGIMAPILIWVTQRENSKFVRFNSLQAIFFQLISIAIMMLFIFVGIVLMLVSMPSAIANPNAEPGTLFFVSMIFFFLYFPIWFIFIIYAIVGAILTYKGKIFRYILLGKIIENKVYK
jgi:uncharacterized Tic20 family protein